MNTLPAPTADCCTTPCDETTVAIPGPAGQDGTDGSDGAAGENSYTSTTVSFIQPAVDGTVTIQVLNGDWMAVGQKIFIENGGYYEVVSKTTSMQIVVKNLGYTGNVAPTTSVAATNDVSPGGIKGADGTDGNPANIPLTTKGDILTRDTTTEVRVGIGANGTRLVADSTQAAGMKYDKVNLNSAAEVAGALALTNGGTGQITAVLGFNAISPVTTRGDIIVRGATNNQRLAVGTTGQVLKSDGTDPSWGKIAITNLDTQTGRAALDPVMFREELASGTDGGTFTSGAWQTRPLNVETYDPGAVGSLAANQITLAAGTYRFRGQAVGYQCDNHQTRLQNITAGTTIAFGTTVRTKSAEDAVTSSEVNGRFTIAGSTVFELQHRCETTRATQGMGRPSTFGNVEVYAWIEFVREAL